ncbi:hypothetical protein O9G_001658 [Rozella allomycis CSF55]|uniref:Uncharacterized protein n=1 Tax=Rozella allomycis (strain CSF55) TaxID=988480 RepID=A0A075B278_ROZAC|nr:hypothetical protein O9G_001658 [Rozella allomycis CSF55]|eukprot:EPZ34928.1 hypothetical protein O9G_001658 [Rozella allomycis CSF55]
MLKQLFSHHTSFSGYPVSKTNPESVSFSVGSFEEESVFHAPLAKCTSMRPVLDGLGGDLFESSQETLKTVECEDNMEFNSLPIISGLRIIHTESVYRNKFQKTTLLKDISYPLPEISLDIDYDIQNLSRISSIIQSIKRKISS